MSHPAYVLVLDCRGEKRVASGGQILTTRLMIRGGAGLVSDGAIRDSGEISKIDFPVYTVGSSAPLNLIHHHALDQNVPTGCGSVAVYPGDIIVGDDDGVAVIPAHLADEVARDAAYSGVTAFQALKKCAGRACCRAPIHVDHPETLGGQGFQGITARTIYGSRLSESPPAPRSNR